MCLLSSGQRARSELVRLLLTHAELLLIDEPTNHLDIAAREWLEDYLSRLDIAYLVVSHDRFFLRQAASRIFEIRHLDFAVYEGNYEFYLEQRELRERQAWEQYQAQQRRSEAADFSARRRLALSNKVAKAPRGIRSGHDFYRSKAAKVARTARILRARVSREPVARKPWQEDAIPPLRFEGVPVSSGVAFRVEGLSKAYDGKVLFRDLSFYVPSGERWGLLGPNGSGKTTLLRILLGQVPPDAGKVQLGKNVRVGYYAQEGENLELRKSPVQLGLEVNPNETWVRTLLGCLRLRGEKAMFPIETMSAGERAKVALARLLLSGSNALLLDEPTNHLDIDAREAVEETLSYFPGTIFFVSHDRYFINTLADEILDLSELPLLERE
jgi:ATP-binding cassette subfamily F protein 3